MRSIICILNAKAGTAPDAGISDYIERQAVERGCKVEIVSAGDGDLGNLARKACERADVVAAGGGDGTVSAVAAAVLESNAALGVLPMGTLNHFAKDMKIPLELERAVDTLFTGVEARVDVGEVNGRVFINNSSVGFYPQIVRERVQKQRRGAAKWHAFAQAVARVLRRGVTMHVTLADSGAANDSLESTFVFVGNNPYTITGLEIGTRARIDGGSLWLCTAPEVNRARLLLLALRAWLGRDDASDLLRREVDDIQIHTRRRRELVSRDGEVDLMRTPLHYRIRPGALRVITPRPD